MEFIGHLLIDLPLYYVNTKLDSVRQDTLIDRFDTSINWMDCKEGP
jgi:hypothetical protein